jgi:hypothetical protein
LPVGAKRQRATGRRMSPLRSHLSLIFAVIRRPVSWLKRSANKMELTVEYMKNIAKNASVLVESMLYDIEKHFPQLTETDDWKQMSEEGKRAMRLVLFEKVNEKSPTQFAEDFYIQVVNAAKFLEDDKKEE